MSAAVSPSIVRDRARRGPGVEAARVAGLDREAEVLLDRERREEIGDLEGAPDPGFRDPLGAQARDRLAAQQDLAGVRHEHARR